MGVSWEPLNGARKRKRQVQPEIDTKLDDVTRQWTTLEDGGRNIGFPLLQQFLWKRVILDEAQGLVGVDRTTEICWTASHLQARAKWVLTGTPDALCIADLQDVLHLKDVPSDNFILERVR